MPRKRLEGRRRTPASLAPRAPGARSGPHAGDDIVGKTVGRAQAIRPWPQTQAVNNFLTTINLPTALGCLSLLSPFRSEPDKAVYTGLQTPQLFVFKREKALVHTQWRPLLLLLSLNKPFQKIASNNFPGTGRGSRRSRQGRATARPASGATTCPAPDSACAAVARPENGGASAGHRHRSAPPALPRPRPPAGPPDQ